MVRLSGDRHRPRLVGMPVLAMAAPDPDQRPAIPVDEADCITNLGHSATTSRDKFQTSALNVRQGSQAGTAVQCPAVSSDRR